MPRCRISEDDRLVDCKGAVCYLTLLCPCGAWSRAPIWQCMEPYFRGGANPILTTLLLQAYCGNYESHIIGQGAKCETSYPRFFTLMNLEMADFAGDGLSQRPTKPFKLFKRRQIQMMAI